MRLSDLSEGERRIAIAAVAAVAMEPFIDDEEFQTVLGFERQELVNVHAGMLRGRDDEETSRAVGQSLNNLIGYPHGMESEVERRVGCNIAVLEALAGKWFGRGAADYFSRAQ